MATEHAVDLDLGFRPEAAISGALLLQSDRTTVLTFNAMSPGRDGRWTDAGVAVIELRRALATLFGLPNDEAIHAHPIARLGVHAYGCYEIMNSSWVQQIERENGRPLSSPDFFRGTPRHFVFTFHDSSLQCIAAELTARLIPPGQRRTEVDDVSDRIFSEEVRV